MLAFFKPKSVTDGVKKSPRESCRGEGTSSDNDVVATGVVGRGEVGAGAGSESDVVVTGVVSRDRGGGAGAGGNSDVGATGVGNGLEGCEGVGIDMACAFSHTADGSGPPDRTPVNAPIHCAGLRPDVGEPVVINSPWS